MIAATVAVFISCVGELLMLLRGRLVGCSEGAVEKTIPELAISSARGARGRGDELARGRRSERATLADSQPVFRLRPARGPRADRLVIIEFEWRVTAPRGSRWALSAHERVLPRPPRHTHTHTRAEEEDEDGGRG
jgi:hypothetical protein